MTYKDAYEKFTNAARPNMTLPNGDVLYEGDYGVTRDGRKVGPIELDPDPDDFYKFLCEHEYCGHNGGYWRDGDVDDNDIIAKWVNTEAVDDTPDYNDGKIIKAAGELAAAVELMHSDWMLDEIASALAAYRAAVEERDT